MLKRIARLLTLKRIVLGIVALLGLTVVAAAAIPGPQRALCPTCFGMVEVADGIYSDTQDQAQTNVILDRLELTRENISDYLGGWSADPRIILCTIENGPCTKLFGDSGTRGMAWGASLIRLNPEGLNETIMQHEFLHVELGSRMGQIGMWNNIIPKWFNEGLAVYLSGDDRFTYDYSDDEKAWARKIISYHDWKREVNESTWPEAYGASAQIVRNIEDKIGKDGIRELINRVTEGGVDFEVVLGEIVQEI